MKSGQIKAAVSFPQKHKHDSLRKEAVWALERKNRTVKCHAMYGSACQTWEAKMKVLPVYNVYAFSEMYPECVIASWDALILLLDAENIEWRVQLDAEKK